MSELVPELEGARNVLVIKPSSLGDIVHALPTVALLKAAQPAAQFRWVANTEWVPVLRGNTDLASVIPFPRSSMGGVKGPFRFWSWSRVLREPVQPDLVIDLQGLFRSGLMASRSKAKHVVGLSDSREGARRFHDRVVEVDPDAHAVERYLCAARALGCEVPGDDARLSFKLPQLRPETEVPRGYVLLHPFSRGEGKSLSVAAVQRFCEAMGETPVLIVGRGGEELKNLPPNAANWIGHTQLAELAWLMANSDYNISVDSGPAHMAAAVGEKLLAIHSWSDPRKVGPYRKRAWVWKGGSICRVGEIDASFAEGDGALPSVEEMEQIAAHVGLAV